MEPTSSPRENILKGKSKIKNVDIKYATATYKNIKLTLKSRRYSYFTINNDRLFLSINNVIKYLFFDEPI